MNTLQLVKVKKYLGGQAVLTDANLLVKQNETIGIIGQNGSGKSTLLSVIAGDLKPDAGQVLLPKHKTAINTGRVYQAPNLFMNSTVLENAQISIDARSLIKNIFGPNKEIRRRALQIIDRVGLGSKKNHLIGELSYGQRRLLETSCRLAQTAQVYLLDEPFAGLDTKKTRLVKRLLINSKGQNKITFLVEHNINLLKQLCDRIFELKKGRLYLV